MRKLSLFLVSALVLSGFIFVPSLRAEDIKSHGKAASSAQQGTDVSSNGPMNKVKNGLMNLLDAPCELPGTIMRTSKEKGIFPGLTEGVFDGVLNTWVRAIVGVFEIGTCPAPYPGNYDPVLEKPKFLTR
ncbi:MAG: exosortase system-associated protein, TIGR04073 family [Candidatus Omnitrophica bacterium]|nr:exosortase system-associated protein, TIGR04073 family [Candidatus Omnitrophota bacterium]